MALDWAIDPHNYPRTIISVHISALINRHRKQPIDARIDLRSSNKEWISVQIKRY